MRNFAWPIIAISLFVVAWNHAGLTPVSAATNDETQAVLQVSRERFAAANANDKVTWSRDTSALYQRIGDDGEVTGKTANLPPAHRPVPDTAHWTSSPTVQFVAGVAIITGTQSETDYFPGTKMIYNYERTEVFAKEDGRWVAIRSQVTPLQINYTRPIASPKNLEQYTGAFQWAPGMVEHIALRGRVLYSSLNGPPDALFFIGPDETMQADDLGAGTFYRDANGGVTGYIYKDCDGQTIRIPKIE
jgi:hypothetical protein